MKHIDKTDKLTYMSHYSSYHDGKPVNWDWGVDSEDQLLIVKKDSALLH